MGANGANRATLHRRLQDERGEAMDGLAVALLKAAPQGEVPGRLQRDFG